MDKPVTLPKVSPSYTCVFETPYGQLAVAEPVAPVDLMEFCQMLLPWCAGVDVIGVQAWSRRKTDMVDQTPRWVKRAGKHRLPNSVSLHQLIDMLVHVENVPAPVAENEVVLAHRGHASFPVNSSVVVDSDGIRRLVDWVRTFEFDRPNAATCTVAFSTGPGSELHAVNWSGVKPTSKAGIKAFIRALLAYRIGTLHPETATYGFPVSQTLLETQVGDRTVRELFDKMIRRSLKKGSLNLAGYELEPGRWSSLIESDETGTTLEIMNYIRTPV